VERFTYRARVSFPGQSRPLLETGRVMARWAEHLVRVLAPELRWDSAVEEHADYELLSRWQASHVVSLVGRDPDGTMRGRGESRLAAGGHGARLGGTGRIAIDTVRPVRHLAVDNHCDVTHWDLEVGSISRAQLDALLESLEAAVGADAQLSSAREAAVEPGERVLARQASDEDLALWLRDLDESGLQARADGRDVVVERAHLPDVEALREARVTLGEIYAEAGHDDWEERALDTLLHLPG
jgi:hypothetical protein